MKISFRGRRGRHPSRWHYNIKLQVGRVSVPADRKEPPTRKTRLQK